MNTEKSTVSNKFAVYIAIGKVVAMVAQFLMPLFLTRFLSKSDYGLYSQFYLLLSFLGTIFCFGLPSNLYYFYPKSTEDTKHKLVWNTYLMTLLAGIVGVLLLGIESVKEVIVGNEELFPYLGILMVCLLLYAPINIIYPLTTVLKDRVFTMAFPPLDVILKIILVIVFAFSFGTLQSIFWAVLLLQLFEFIFVFFYLERKFPLAKRRNVSVDLAKQQFLYAFPFGLAVLLNTACQQIDRLVCVSYLSASEYAVYSLAFFGIPGIRQIYDSICQVNVVNMSVAYTSNNMRVVLNLYKRFVVQTLSFSLPLILIVFVFSPQIIGFLFPPQYVDAVPFFRIYILTFIVGMLGGGTVLRAIGKTKYSMKAYGFACMICIPMTYLLIRSFGIWGAIFSAVLNSIIPRLLQIVFEMRQMNVSAVQYFPWKSIGRIFGISVLGLIPILVFQILWGCENIFLCLCLGLAYLLFVYCLEVRYNVFLVDSAVVRSKMFSILDRLKKRG